jgi:hypothetical protein
MRTLYRLLPLALFFTIPTLAASVDDVAVTPLPGPASCYAGTAGVDNVMFWRANPFLDCQAFSGPASPCLTRREAALGDPPTGKPVSLLAGPYQRPSLTGAGDVVIFTEYGFNICLMNSASEDTEGCYGRDFLDADPHTGAWHPDGVVVALTRLNPDTSFEPTNDIFILNPATFVLQEVYEVIDGPFEIRIDTVDFTVDNEYLIIDAQNAGNGLWGIYAIPRDIPGHGSVPVTPIPLVAPVAGLIIRNPQLAQTSDDHMVFDVYDLATGTNHVLAANLLTGDVQTVVSFTSNFTSYPSYTGDDSAIIFSAPDGNTTLTTFSLNRQALAADRMTPVGASSLWLADGYAPAVYRRGAWNGTLLPPAVCAPVQDADGDGVADDQDNCSAVANADQNDADADNFGNLCDADFNNDCIVNAVDLGFLKSVFFSNNAEADLNGDGLVNAVDLGIFKSRFFIPPGPSGLADICD